MSGADKYPSRVTGYSVCCWLLAACGGLMFGYDIGISGGVTGMDDFLIKFFPHVYQRKLNAHENNYCKFDDQFLQLFTSSLYLSALVFSFLGSKICSSFGRKITILLASLAYFIGTLLSALATNLVMVIIGRVIMGIGVGFGNEAVPLFLSEVAPVKYRGGVNILFQFLVTVGIFIANLVNYGTSQMKTHNGWRFSLGGALVPGALLLIGSLVIKETPTSLIERGRVDEGKRVLKKIRGVEEVEAEFEEIKAACENAKLVKQPFKELKKRKSRPPMVISICIQVFQQMTGINAIMFYAPILFQTVGFKSGGSLVSAVIIGCVNVLSTLFAVFCVDKFGRRKLLLCSCVLMLISQVAVGGLLINMLHDNNTLPRVPGVVVVFLLCFFVSAFAWSWGPMGWLIPSEIFPVETRTAGYAFAVSSNMLFTFLLAQGFLSTLCLMKAWVFIFFSFFIVVMGVFVMVLLPETKGVPIDMVTERVWKPHSVWRKYVEDDEDSAKA